MSNRSSNPNPPDRRPVARIVESTVVYTLDITSEITGVSIARIRSYERRGLINATRDPVAGLTFAESEIEEIRRIERITVDLGVNMAGVEVILHMRNKLLSLQDELKRLRRISQQ